MLYYSKFICQIGNIYLISDLTFKHLHMKHRATHFSPLFLLCTIIITCGFWSNGEKNSSYTTKTNVLWLEKKQQKTNRNKIKTHIVCEQTAIQLIKTKYYGRKTLYFWCTLLKGQDHLGYDLTYKRDNFKKSGILVICKQEHGTKSASVTGHRWVLA